MSVLRLKINHNVDASPSLAKTRYLIHSKQDVANIQTEEQKNIRMQMMSIRQYVHERAPSRTATCHHPESSASAKHHIL